VTRSEAELRQQLEDSESLPYGDARTAVVEEILVQTDAQGKSKLAFDVRMELISCYENGAQPDRAFVPFAWCLAAFDRGEWEFSDWDAELLRWYYKWMIGAMRRFPTISLDQVYSALADMERRYRAGGHSMHAVHMLRCLVFTHLGDREAAEHEFRQWISSPRDENSDCEGCEPTKRLNHHVWMGRDAEGLALAEPALAAERGCREQPQSMLTSMMIPLVRAGRTQEAWSAHRRAYRLHRGNRDSMGEIAEHIEFCARTGHEARGLEILSRHLDWVDRPREPYSDLAFAASSALLLRRLEELGHAELAIMRPAFETRPAGEVSVATLRAELTDRVRSIAAQFDARNGNTYQSGIFEDVLAAEPLFERSESAAPPMVSPAEPVMIPDDLTPEEIADLAEAAWVAWRTDEADAGWQRLSELESENSLPVSLIPRLAEAKADRHLRGAGTDAIAFAQQAIDGYAKIGDEPRRLRASAILGAAMTVQDADSDGLAILEEAYAVPDLDPAIAREIMRLRASSLAQVGHYEDALIASSETVEFAETAELSVLESEALATHGRLLCLLDREDEGIEAVDRARQLAGKFSTALLFASHTQLLAEILYSRGQLEEAYAAAGEIVGLALPAGQAFLARAHDTRWAVLRDSGRAAEPESLQEALAALERWQASGDRVGAAKAALHLGSTHFDRGQWLDAAEMLEQALRAWEEAGQSDDADTVWGTSLLGTSQAELGERIEAVGNLARAGAGFAAMGAFRRAGEDMLEAGMIDLSLEDSAAAAAKFTDAADYFEQASWPAGVVIALQRKSRALALDEESDPAEVAMQAYERALTLSESDEYNVVWLRADAADDAARALLSAEEYQQALGFGEIAFQGYAEAGDTDAVAESKLFAATVYFEMEDYPAAESTLRAMLAEPASEGTVYRAKSLLGSVFEAAGSTDEAQKVWNDLLG
jgi:tetratricopeptide (TPR) repeat protein